MVTGVPLVPPPVLHTCRLKVSTAGPFIFVVVVADFRRVKAGGLGVGSIGRVNCCLKNNCMQSFTAALLVAL